MTGLQRLDVDGHSIAYREAGQGPPLVVLHGFLCDSRCWIPQLTNLSDRFRVVAWDAPGAGASSDPSEPFTNADWAQCLASFLDMLGVEQANICGLSWGGILAQEFYRVYPERIMRLILADTYAGWRGSLGEDASAQRVASCFQLSSGPADELLASFMPGAIAPDASAEAKDALAAIVSEFHPVGFRLMTLACDVDTSDVLATIDIPTLLVWGEVDWRSPLHVAEAFRDAIPGAELAVIPGSGHISNMEKPEEFNAHVRRFCDA